MHVKRENDVSERIGFEGPWISNIQNDNPVTNSSLTFLNYISYFYVFKICFPHSLRLNLLYFSVALNMDQESACCLTNALVGTRNRIRCSLLQLKVVVNDLQLALAFRPF